MQPKLLYSKAPITEALIDLRVRNPPEIEVSRLKVVQEILQQEYPSGIDLSFVQGQFQFSPEGATASTSNTLIGYRLSTADEKQVLQVQVDGFTFSRLAPYESWEGLRDEAHRLWEIYTKVVCSERVQRVAVRYINRLDLPLDQSRSLDFKQYLRTIPEVSPDLPQGLSSYLMQLQIPQADLNAELIISQALLSSSQEDRVPVLLDIDLFSSVDLPIDHSPWDVLEKLRVRKNEVFEACITEKARELLR